MATVEVANTELISLAAMAELLLQRSLFEDEQKAIEGEIVDVPDGFLAELQAAGLTAVKQVGDLAQVSVGATGAESPLIGLMNWAIDWKRKVVDSTTTEQNGYAGNLASTASWSATADFAYIDGDATQATIRAAITTLQYTSTKYNFTNAPATGRDSWSGNGILTGIKFTSGSGKIFGMNLTIEGDGALTLIPQLAPQAGTGTQPALVAED